MFRAPRSASIMPPKERQAIDLNTLDAQQLSSIREQLEEEVQSFVRSSVALQKAAGEFGSSGRAIESLSEQKEGQPLLLPLTSSLYVAGTLASTDNVLVDIGTGYYMEKSTEEGIDYCKRKVMYLKEKLDQIGAAIKDKQRVLAEVNGALGRKMQQTQKA
ncbi:g2347 [Coccomyxa elongata]